MDMTHAPNGYLMKLQGTLLKPITPKASAPMENTKMTVAALLLRLTVGISQAANGVSVEHDDGESVHTLLGISDVMSDKPDFASILSNMPYSFTYNYGCQA
jgi:hypothetical protein